MLCAVKAFPRHFALIFSTALSFLLRILRVIPFTSRGLVNVEHEGILRGTTSHIFKVWTSSMSSMSSMVAWLHGRYIHNMLRESESGSSSYHIKSLPDQLRDRVLAPRKLNEVRKMRHLVFIEPSLSLLDEPSISFLIALA